MGVLDEVKHALGFDTNDKQETADSDLTFSSGKKPSAAEEVKQEAVKSSSTEPDNAAQATSQEITTNSEEAHAKPTPPALGSRSTTDTNVTATTNGADDNASMIPLGKGQNTVGTSTPQAPVTETLGTSVLNEGQVSSEQDFAVREIERAALIREMENCDKGREGIHFSEKDDGAPDGRAEVETIIGRFPNIKSLTGSMRRISLNSKTLPAVEGDMSSHSIDPEENTTAGESSVASAVITSENQPTSSSAQDGTLTSLQREELNKVPETSSDVPQNTASSTSPDLDGKIGDATASKNDDVVSGSESPAVVSDSAADPEVSKAEPVSSSTEASPAAIAASDKPVERSETTPVSVNTAQEKPLSRTPSKSGRRLSGLFRRGSKKTSGPSPSASTADLNASTTSLGSTASPAKTTAPVQPVSNGPSAASTVRPRTPPFRSRRNTASEGSGPAVAQPSSDATPLTESTAGQETAGNGTIPSGTSHGADTAPHDSTTSADLGVQDGKTDSANVPASNPPAYHADRAAEGGEISQAEKAAVQATPTDLASVETGGVGPRTAENETSEATNAEPTTRKRASSGLAGKLGQEIEERARAQRDGRVYDGPGASTWIKAPTTSESQPSADTTTSASMTPSTSTRDVPAATTGSSNAQTGSSPYGNSNTGIRASESSTSLSRPPSRSGGGLGGLFRRKSRRVSTSSVGGSTTNLKASESTASLIDPTSDAKPVTSTENANTDGAVIDTGKVADGTLEDAPVATERSDVEQEAAHDKTVLPTEKVADDSAAGEDTTSKPTSVNAEPTQNGLTDANEKLAQEIEDRAVATESSRPVSTHTSDIKQPSIAAEEANVDSQDMSQVEESTETAVVPKETTSIDNAPEAPRPRSDSVSRSSDAGLTRTPSRSGGGLGGLFRRRSRRLSKASLGGSTTNLNASTTSLGDGSADQADSQPKSTVVSSIRPRTPPFRSRRNTLTESAPPAADKEPAADAVAGDVPAIEREVSAAEPASMNDSSDVFAHSVPPVEEAGLQPREVVAEPEAPVQSSAAETTDDDKAINGSTAPTTLKRSSSGLAFSLTKEIEERAKAAREGREYSGPGSQMWIKPGVPTSSSESNLKADVQPQTAPAEQVQEPAPVESVSDAEASQLPASASKASLSDERQPEHTVPLAQTQSRADSVASASGASAARSPSKTKSGIFGGLFRRRSKRLSTGSQPGSTTDLNASTTSLVDDSQPAGTEGAAVSSVRPRTPPFRSRRNTLTSTEDLPSTGTTTEEVAQPVEEVQPEATSTNAATETNEAANTSTGIMTSPSGHFDDQYLPPVQEVSEAGSMHEEETDEAEYHPSPYNTMPGSASRASLAHLLSQEIEERAKAQREGKEYTGRGSQIWLKSTSNADLALPQERAEEQTAVPVTQPSAFHEDFDSQHASEQPERTNTTQDEHTQSQRQSAASPVVAKPAETQTKRKSGFFANLFRSRTKEQPSAYKHESTYTEGRPESTHHDAAVQTQDGASVREGDAEHAIDHSESMAAHDDTFEEQSVVAPEPIVDNRPIFEIACDTPLPAPTYTAKTQARLDRQRRKREYEEFVERERVRREEELLAKRERIMTAYTGRQDFSKVPTPKRTKPFGNKKELEPIQHVVKPDRATRKAEAAESGGVRSRGSSVSSAPYGSPTTANRVETPTLPASPLSPTSPKLGVDPKLAQELPGASRHQYDHVAIPLSPSTRGAEKLGEKPAGEPLKKKPSTKRKTARPSTELAESAAVKEQEGEVALKKKPSTKRKAASRPSVDLTDGLASQEQKTDEVVQKKPSTKRKSAARPSADFTESATSPEQQTDGTVPRKPSSKRQSVSRPSAEFTERPEPIERKVDAPGLGRRRSMKEKLLRQNEDGEEEQSYDAPQLTRQKSLKDRLLRQNED